MKSKLIGSITTIAVFLTMGLPGISRGAGVAFTVNDVGLQTLTYNRQSYLAYAQYEANQLVSSALFRSPDGTDKPYGGLTIRNAVRSAGTSYFQHIYRQGSADSFTVKVAYTATDARTLKVDASVTNNDTTDSLAQINLQNSFLPLRLPRAATQYNQNIPIVLGPLNQNGAYPAALLSNTWGSIGLWMGDYSGTAGMAAYYNSPAQTEFDFALSNNSANQIGHVYEDPISPGATKVYTTYLRFGSSTDTAASLAPEAFASFRQAFPYLVNWPDRRPIARWLIAEGSHTSDINPRGYLWDPALDVSNQNNFNARILSLTDDIINRMNGMNPRPQGILIWDLEGEEFHQWFTYVGNPPKLHDLAPEMDAVADQMFTRFKNAGYQVGMTLRPSNFMTGTTLPATCNSSSDPDPNSGVVLQDVFIKVGASYPYRGYICSAPNTWTQPGAREPHYQAITNDDTIIYNDLKAKVAYARNRWGAKMFYADSTVYSKGAPFNFTIWRQLQKDFPDTILFPENDTVDYWGASAPYNEARQGYFDTPQASKDIYPQAFSVLQTIDGVDYANQTARDALVNSVQDGNILFVDGWWDNPNNANILQIYRDASPSPSPPPPPRRLRLSR